MNTPEFIPQESIDLCDDDPEPRPIPIEQVDELLHIIKTLWSEREKREHRTSTHEVDMRLLHAYSQLEHMCGNVRNKETAANIEATHPDAFFELWFACNHLGKVLKLRHN